MAQKNPFVDLWACFWNRWTAAVEVKCHRKILASEAKNEKKLIKKRGGNKRRDGPETISAGISSLVS